MCIRDRKYQVQRNEALWNDAARGDAASVKGCIEAGADIDSIDRSSEDQREHVTALMRASGSGAVMVMATLLKLGANIQLANDQGWTALTVAAIKGRADAIGVLVSRGLRVDERSVGPDQIAGYTALMWASLGGHTEAVEALLKRGADLDLVNSQGKSAADIAIDEEHEEVLAVLLPACSPQLQLWLASRTGNCDQLKLALESGAEVNRVDERSEDPSTHLSALLHAAREGHREAMELLLEAGASPAPGSANGYTALHMAAYGGQLEAVHLCFRENVDCNMHTSDFNQDTALHHAARSWSPAKRLVLEFLLSQGLQKAAKNKDGQTATDAARKAKYHKVADWLEALE
eukprot:TRINITY_DN28432_c0_g1_i1.p1 TRINITY_DN28432_c0_g1~~TRINITY_DN28432_c0_g1_i1.p1  ORF type:complete len:347 (-),score=88.07 TRINITY_DN28432_c0_g1_i1:232-1272(-)